MRCIEDVGILYSATKRREDIINTATWVDLAPILQFAILGLSLVFDFV